MIFIIFHAVCAHFPPNVSQIVSVSVRGCLWRSVGASSYLCAVSFTLWTLQSAKSKAPTVKLTMGSFCRFAKHMVFLLRSILY